MFAVGAFEIKIVRMHFTFLKCVKTFLKYIHILKCHNWLEGYAMQEW